MENKPTTATGRLRGALTGKRGVVIGVGAAVLVAGAALVPVALRNDATPAPAPPAPAAAPDTTTPPAPTPGVIDFHSPAGGFSLSYPSSWTRLNSTDPQVPLVVDQGPHSFLVRVVELPGPVNAQNLPTAKQLTDKIVLSDPSVKLLADPKPVSLSGLPGYFYFYTFTDHDSGLTGAHSHFFLFKGTTMVVLVFQSMPADAFRTGADTFDQITASFRAE